MTMTCWTPSAPMTSDDVNVDALGENAGEAQRIFDRVGWP
jgi:iron(III) transport system substrate-binding protein